MRAFHYKRRLNKQSDEGTHTFAVGLRFGFWPCLKAPFVQASLGRHVHSFWYGKEYK